MKKRMSDRHPSLKTGQRMTERTRSGAKEVKTETKDEEGVEIVTSRPENQVASLL